MVSGKKATRQKRILDELEIQPTLRVSDLAERLGVSTETVRRDFDEMTAQGLIQRTYGGAVRQMGQEPGINERHGLLIEERQYIARLAIPALTGCKHVMIGCGATTVHVARRLAIEMNDLTVFTHSLGVATALALNPTIRVIVVPGDYHSGEGAMVGALTLRFLEDFQADWAIVGASGLDENGATDALVDAAEVYAKMARQSARTMVVADSSKFEQAFPARYAGWERIDMLVSEKSPPPGLVKTLRSHGVVLKVDEAEPLS